MLDVETDESRVIPSLTGLRVYRDKAAGTTNTHDLGSVFALGS